MSLVRYKAIKYFLLRLIYVSLYTVFKGMQKLDEKSAQNALLAAFMAMANKIWLTEMTDKTAEQVIEDIWSGLKNQYKSFESDRSRPSASIEISAAHPGQDVSSSGNKKKIVL